MALNLKILYRGPLSSCNYGCDYCPFAKRRESDEQHASDAAALERFISWVESRKDDQISVFFTPWGEALVRTRYQKALVRLTNLCQVSKAAIQTNGSCRFDWADKCDKNKLGLWVTYHPTQTSRSRFLAQCEDMASRGLRFSVGVVGLREHFDEIEALRTALPSDVYLWVNAFKRIDNYYSPSESEFLTAIDRLFPFNNQYHSSYGRACRTGETVISVDGDGTIRRCHFVKVPLGNLYDPNFENILKPRPCENDRCGCHIGYVHMPELRLDETFGDGILERIPC
jgi:MoaA/NifB/PqqE/SkfB family radical SAM enzyme